jgi:hypothetical protein
VKKQEQEKSTAVLAAVTQAVQQADKDLAAATAPAAKTAARAKVKSARADLLRAQADAKRVATDLKTAQGVLDKLVEQHRGLAPRPQVAEKSSESNTQHPEKLQTSSTRHPEH